MTITWRDTTAMLAIGLVVVAIFSIVADLPVAIADWRAAALMVILLGIVMFVVLGPRFLPTQEPWVTVAMILHPLAIILAVLSLIIGDRIAFTFLAVDLVGLWVIATVYHIRSSARHTPKQVGHLRLKSHE